MMARASSMACSSTASWLALGVRVLGRSGTGRELKFLPEFLGLSLGRADTSTLFLGPRPPHCSWAQGPWPPPHLWQEPQTFPPLPWHRRCMGRLCALALDQPCPLPLA